MIDALVLKKIRLTDIFNFHWHIKTYIPNFPPNKLYQFNIFYIVPIKFSTTTITHQIIISNIFMKSKNILIKLFQ